MRFAKYLPIIIPAARKAMKSPQFKAAVAKAKTRMGQGRGNPAN